MKIDYYQGLKAQKGADRVDDLVQHLMTCDIVVTTYNVLSSEIHYANDVSERRSRYEKKYAARRSPLMLMSWWRVCLDGKGCPIDRGAVDSILLTSNQRRRWSKTV